MDLANPAINPPVLQPQNAVKRFSQHSRTHSRSPSHSPARPYSPLGLDPLLRSLSPTATLHAFSAAHTFDEASRSPSPRRRQLKASFSNASEQQRDLGSRAAQACLDIRGWTRELQSWHWPGSFDEPTPARKKARMSVMSIGSLASAITNATNDVDAEDGSAQKDEYWGSLPASTIQDRDARCQEIATGLDDIDIEELKEFALQAHNRESTSIDGQLDAAAQGPEALERKELDDFTAVITATVLQTLPYLSQLNRLLDIWTIRIAVSKQVPTFLGEMDRMKRDLDHGWAAVAVSLRKNGEFATLGAQNMQDMQKLIETRMTALGSTLDGFLDILEGQDDCVPDMFLDKFEELEERYAEWVVTAQQRVLGDELKSFEPSPTTPISATARLVNGAAADDRASSPVIQTVERKGSLVLHDNDSMRSPVLHEFERAKTPLIPEVERAKTPVIETAITSAVGQTAHTVIEPSISSLEQDDDDLVRETQKSLQLRSLAEDMSQSTGADTNIPAQFTAESNQATQIQELPASPVRNLPEPRPLSSHAPGVLTEPPNRSRKHVPSVLPQGQDVTARPTSARPSTGHSSSTPRPSTDATVSIDNGRSRSKARKGNVLSRIFKRDKSRDVKRDKSAASKSVDESRGRSDSSSSFVRAARRSFSRKRASKAETAEWRGSDMQASSNGTQPQTSIDRSRGQDFQRPGTMEGQAERTKFRNVLPAEGGSPRPQTYQPKGMQPRPLSAREPDFPDNWPLSPSAQHMLAELPADSLHDQHPDPVPPQHVEGGADFDDLDLRTVRSMAAINSDNFLDVFIGGFPVAPTSQHQDGSLTTQADLALASLTNDRNRDETNVEPEPQTPTYAPTPAETEEDISVLTATPPLSGNRVRIPVVTSFMLSSDGRQDDLSVARAISIDGLRQFDAKPSTPRQRDKEVGIQESGDKGNAESPVVLGASLGERARDEHPESQLTVEQGAAGLLSRNTNTSTYPAPRPGRENFSEPRPDSEILPLQSSVGGDALLHADEHHQHSRQMSTDTTNEDSGVETTGQLNRASMTSIKAHAASELRSIDVPPRSRDSMKAMKSQPTSEVQSPAVVDTSPDSRRSSLSYFHRPGIPRTNSRSGAQSPTSSIDTPNFSRLRSSSVDTEDHHSPRNIAVAKRRLREPPGLATITPSAEYAESPTSPAAENAREHPAATRTAPADNFDRHVSEVLDSLPAPIRFRTKAGVDISSTSRFASTRTNEPKSLRPRVTSSNRQSSGGGLTLAPAENSPRKAAPADPQIKLYHLTQAGREEPIKLFVRLVGDGERVMVRVGGGWSDLADFLRQYAEHHGSRTVSGSISGLELQTATASPAGSRRTSGVVPITAERHTGSSNREGQVDSTIAVVPEVADVPKSVSVIEGLVELPGSEPPMPVTEPVKTPDKSSHKLHRQGSKEALSDQKARWVTRMLEKAKRETALSRKSKGGDAFGSIDKVGGTKRVVYRSSSALGHNTASNKEQGTQKRT